MGKLLLDPELDRQMSVAARQGGTVEAVVRLQANPGSPAPLPEETERLTHELVQRAQRSSGEHEEKVNVFKYLGSFAVSAPPSFIRALIDQPEVASAVANRQSENGMISPVEKRPAQIEDVGRESAPRRKRKESRSKPARSKTRRVSR